MAIFNSYVSLPEGNGMESLLTRSAVVVSPVDSARVSPQDPTLAAYFAATWTTPFCEPDGNRSKHVKTYIPKIINMIIGGFSW